jgi:ABC-2 type transport system permease protein
MNLQRILAITGRVISQFRHDHRSLGLLFVAPILVMSIFGYVFRSQENQTTSVALVNEDRPAAGQQSAAAPLVDSLKSNADLVITELSGEAAVAAVRDGSHKVAIIFGPNFSQELIANRKANIDVTVEGSNPGQASAALAAVSQSIMRDVTLVFRQLVPPAFASAVPAEPPLSIDVTRLYGSADLQTLDFFAPMFIAYIGFFMIFLLTSVSFLRERTQGTMERLSASPVTRLELVLGYMLGFGFFSVLQALVLVLFTIYALQVKFSGNLLSIFVITLALVLGAVNLGILLSAFARNELQAIQFIPIVILPQVLLSGLLWPVQEMPAWLQTIAHLMPLTYAIEALTDIMIRGHTLAANWLPLTVLLAFAAVVAVLAATTVRREVA